MLIRVLLQGVSKSKLSASQQQTIKAGKNMAKWVAGNVLTLVRRRAEYGAETEVNSMIRDAKYFKTAQVDALRLSDTKARTSELESEIKERLDEINAKKGNSEDLKRQLTSLEEEKKSIISEKTAKQQILSQYDKAKTHMQNEQEKLTRYESEGRDFKKKVAEQESSMVELSMERVGAASLYAVRKKLIACFLTNRKLKHRWVRNAFETMFRDMTLLQPPNYTSSNLRRIFNIITLGTKVSKIALKGKEGNATKAIKARYDDVIAQAAKARDECRELMSVLSSAQSEEIQSTHSKKAIGELKAEIEQEEIRLESIHEGNPNAIKQYEAREKEINDLRTTMEKKEADLNKHRNAIKDVRGRWEPRIDQLVSNISDAFSRSFEFIHCAGAVRIRKEGVDGCDFENWAIEIMVKFREAENMQVLTAQRQSGGERAVSTVFYLMALQSLARAPFRVVDEINQGMDPRNERLVHKRMVKIACKKHTSQ
ncbi:hypothetical protein AA313_de0210046 [Arthrobotrys entomopaga]|nr:hypothetical protein AA313_de0210046 [Arthrobotrys entomopaga]